MNEAKVLHSLLVFCLKYLFLFKKGKAREEIMKRINYDVLVVGGGAGLMEAYEATKYNVRVSVVSKGKI